MNLGLPLAALLLAALIIADFFVPMIPSATMVAAAAGFLVGDPLLIAGLIAWAAAASWLGDVLGFHVLRRTRARMRRPIFDSAKITRLEIRLRTTLRRRPRRTTVVARFLPAGRTALAWAAVATPDYPHSRTSALAAAAWSSHMVGVGLLVGWLFGAGPLAAATTATSVAAMTVVLGWWHRGYSAPGPRPTGLNAGDASPGTAAPPATVARRPPPGPRRPPRSAPRRGRGR